MKHTPGPWEIGKLITCQEEGPSLCWHTYSYQREIYPPLGHSGPIATISGEEEANARLIAAAPELLEALKGVYSTYVFLESLTAGIEPQHTNTVNALARIRAAIDKAEGR